MDSDAIDFLSGQASSLDIQDAPHNRIPQAMGYEMDPPPAPKIHSKGITATDMTAHFISAAQQLPLGELVKDEYFTLFESVGAVELMDPKMDTGYLAEGDTLEDEYDIARHLLPEEVLGIMDQLMCLEMAWHMGHPLSQTIFTGLYIDHLFSMGFAEIESPTYGSNGKGSDAAPLLQVLRAYCLGLLKTCWHVNNRVKSEHYYEEEDFVTHTYNRNLLENIGDSAILSFLRSSKDSLALEPSIGANIRSGLDDRLNFRIAFLGTVSEVEDRSSTRLGSSWRHFRDTITALQIAQNLGKPVPEAFSGKLQRKLASTVPPRPTVTTAFTDAYEHLKRLCGDGETVSEVLEYHDSQSLITFVSLFQSRKPQPSVYIRTLLQHYLFGDMIMLGTMSVRQVLDDDFASTTLPANILLNRLNDEIEVPHDPRHYIAQTMESFRSRAAQSYLDVLRTLCQNRCRIRRTLHHAIADWENLQLDSEELDIELRGYTGEKAIIDPSYSSEPLYAFPLSSWAYFYKLKCMEYSTQMGFELAVFQTWELAGMYFYLHYITTSRIRHLERMRMFVGNRSSQHKSESNRSGETDLEFARSLSFLNFSMLEATATSGLGESLSLLYAVLSRIGAIPTPEFPYSDNSIRYELRMKPFLSVSLPAPIPYQQFQDQVMHPEESVTNMILLATEVAGHAKKDFEILAKLDANTARCKGHWCEDAWKKNLKDCLRSSIMAGIGIAAVKKGMEKCGDGHEAGKNWKVEVPDQGKGYHDWWVVPKIVVVE